MPWLVAALIASAAAADVAVLPLTRGAGGEAVDGLGRAIAGMLTTDLQAAGVPLVERAQLDAVLGELALVETGFVDPATAQTVGKGIGADRVVVGTVSVVGQTFRLDVQLVDVATGRVLDSAGADGSPADFVALEKEVVEALLDDLAVELSSGDRRKILLDAPTESFEAMRAYAKGLAEVEEGRIAEAGEAFAKAASIDPGFDQAARALDALQAQLEAQRAEASNSAHGKALRVARQLVADTSPPSKTAPTDADLGLLELRWMALRNLGEACQVAEEMARFADMHGVPDGSWKRNAAWQAQTAFLDGRGFAAWGTDLPGPAVAHRSVSRRHGVFDGAHRYVLGGLATQPLDHEDSWVGAIRDCHGVEGTLRELTRLERRVAADKVGLETSSRWPRPLPLAVARVAAELATTQGTAGQVTQRTTAVLDQTPAAGQDEAQRWAARMVQQARNEQQQIVRLLGLSPDQIRAGVAVDPTSWTGPCAALAAQERGRAVETVAKSAPSWDDKWGGFQERHQVSYAAPYVRAAQALGCVDGPAHAASFPAAVAWIRASLARWDASPPSCATYTQSLGPMTSPQMVERLVVAPPQVVDQQHALLVIQRYQGTQFGCIEPGE